jgi:hypothetical protein
VRPDLGNVNDDGIFGVSGRHDWFFDTPALLMGWE